MILEADDQVVKLIGYGVYEGDFPYPYASRDGMEFIQKAILDNQDRVAENVRKDLRKTLTERGASGDDIEKAVQAFDDKVEEERTRPIEERAEDIWRQHVSTPRIRLDDDRGYVWGCEVWWCPERDKDDVIGGREVILVDPPSREG